MAQPRSRLPKLIRRPLLALLALLALAVSAQTASAQAVPPNLPGTAASGTAAKPDTAADIDGLIKTLDDPAARDKLKQQLQLLLQAQQGGATGAQPAEQGFGAQLLASISHHVESVSNALVNLVEVIADLPHRLQLAGEALADPQRRAYWLDVAVDIAGVIAVAFIAAWAARRLMRGPRRALMQRQSPRWFVRLLHLPLIVVVEALPILGLTLASYIALPLFDPSEDARLITSAIIGAQAATMLTTAISASLLLPAAPGLRLFAMSDETAAYLQVWVRRLAVVGFYGYAVTELAALIGIEASLHEVISRAWGLLLTAMGVIFILQNRIAVARWIAGGSLDGPAEPPQHDEPVATPLPEPETTPETERAIRFRAFRRQAAKVWHILAIAYVVASYAVWSLQIEGGFAFLLRATVLTAILGLVIRLADTFLRQIFDRSFALPDEVKRVLPGLEARANRYLPVMKQALLAVIYLASLFALLQIWGLDMIGWLSDGAGRPVMTAAVKIVLVLVISAILSEVVNLAIEHWLRDTDQHGRRIYHSSRIRTLLPLLRNAFRITLGVIILLVVLSEIGIDIGPLLAAAGVVGLAIGFGAQTLVKDIITGVFILIEDTIAIGDVVDLGGHAGVVEGMTIRTIRLRDLGGTVHTVPFSSVTIVQNLTKDFSYALWEIKIDYRGDVDRALDVMREVGTAIEKDRDFRYSVLGPIEIIGVDGFQDTGLIVKARMKTRPMSQWDVMRAFNRRLKLAFDEAGILFAGMMAAMPPQRATVHEITVKGASTTVGDATDEAIVQAALKAAAKEASKEAPKEAPKDAPRDAPKAADAQARQAEGKGEPPPASNAPPSQPR